MKYFLGIVLGLTCIIGSAQGAAIYVYENLRGDRLITDHPRSDLKGYKLVKQYGVDDYFGLPVEPGATRQLKPRASQYDELIITQARKMGLEPALLKAIVHVESSFNTEAVSPKGARGLMQLMPATAERYGVAAVHDPVASLEGGGRYMRDLLSMFDNDLELALAAYNAGENSVLRYNGIPPYPETQNYVQMVITLLDKYRRELQGVELLPGCSIAQISAEFPPSYSLTDYAAV